MTKGRKTPTGTGRGRKKPKLRKETIRDLDAKKAGKGVKGGWNVGAATGACKTAGCPTQGCETQRCVTIVGCGILIG